MANFTSLDDRELLAALKNGDEAAFTEIYRRYQPAMLRHAQRMVGHSNELCADFLQDVFLKFWQGSANLEIKVSLPALLHTMLRNRILDYLAQDKVRLRYLNERIGELSIRDNTVFDHLVEKDLFRLIEEEIQTLPEKMKQIFQLSRQQQLTHEEISQQLNIAPNTVKVQISNALGRIRKRLSKFSAYFSTTTIFIFFN